MVVTKSRLLRQGNSSPEGLPKEPDSQRRSLRGADKASRKVLLVVGVVLIFSLAILGYFYLKHRSEVAQATQAVPTHLPAMPQTSRKFPLAQGTQVGAATTQAPPPAASSSAVYSPLEPTAQLTATKNPFTPLVSPSAAAH